MKSKAGWLVATCGIIGLWSAIAAAQQQPPPNPQDLAKVAAAAPTSAPAKPAKARKVLVFGRTAVGAFFEKGYVHKSIPLGCEAIGMLGEKTGAYQAVVSYDASMFDADKLKEFDAIVLVSTTHDFLDEPNDKKIEETRKQALLSFV